MTLTSRIGCWRSAICKGLPIKKLTTSDMTILAVAVCLILFAPFLANAATQRSGTFPPKSGALLEIDGTQNGSAVHLKIYDSQIHTSVVQAPPAGTLSNDSNCNPDDLVPTDAYVLQGGSATGCDPGDAFETTQQLGSATLGSFTITTNYPLVGHDVSEYCESMGNTTHICIGGANTSVAMPSRAG